ncbi:hypothetical protein E1301_Tti004878 [Triplophysa tibetana]|uniref:Uncharacterized protein n=1 Tax=Triplophysa tibetana TaxID=1572043 RepID=A0A5A9NUH6_9TELE|nr:hypothetical protein E1301_Tti004878 [Triplophysa tibetana]
MHQGPVKKLKTVHGHLCNVSPLKDSEKPYFEASLQHEGECSSVMVFKPEEHMEFKNAEKFRSQVMLRNVISPHKTNGTSKVYYTHKSSMSCVRDLLHAFRNTLPAEAHGIQLSELLKLDPKPKRVIINVKIILEESKGNNVLRDRRRYLPNTVYTVADSTGFMSLTVWCQKEITVGKWYNFTNVTTVQFKGKTTLSTTKDTNILNIPSQGTAVDVEVPIESMKYDIIGVNPKMLFICPGNHELKDLILSSPSVYCVSCKIHYKTSASIMKISGRLHLKPETGEIIRARVEDEVIRSVIAVKPDASQNVIIHAFMALPTMQITISNNVIVKMEESTSQNTLSTGKESQTSLAVMEPVEDLNDFSPPDPGIFSSQPQKRKLTH